VVLRQRVVAFVLVEELVVLTLVRAGRAALAEALQLSGQAVSLGRQLVGLELSLLGATPLLVDEASQAGSS